MRCPYRENAGFVCARQAHMGGWIVVYDRKKGFEVDADQRWIVMHEPSSGHVEVKSRAEARWIMEAVAQSLSARRAQVHADILPTANYANFPKVGQVVFMVGDYRAYKVAFVDDADREVTLGFASLAGEENGVRLAPIRWEHFVWDKECSCWRVGHAP